MRSVLAIGLAAALWAGPGAFSGPGSGTANAAPRAAASAPDLLGPVIARRYRVPVDTLIDKEAADLRTYEVSRKFLNGRDVTLDYTDTRYWPRVFDPNGGWVSPNLVVPWPENGQKPCHAVLEVDGRVIALGANGGDEWVSGRGVMRKTRWVTSTFEAPFSEEDETNARIQVVGRRAESGKLRSSPACPSTTAIHRSEIDAVDWRVHFQAYPANGTGSEVPGCIRGQLERLGAPASGRTAGGEPSGRSINPLSWRGRKVIEACRRWHLRRTDFECTLRGSTTRCEDRWRRNETEETALDLQGMTDHLLSAREATVARLVDETGPMRAERRAREERAALAQRQEAERRAAEAEARRRWEASPEGRAALAAKAEQERQAEARRAREFPYYVLIRCGDIRHTNIAVCLDYDAETTLRLRNGGTETLYNLTRIFSLRPGWETAEGYRIDLRPSYGLIIQNSSPQIMGVRIYERRTGRQVFAREVGRYGTIATAR